MLKEYDVIIVGAGSSGLRLSYLLPKDLKILVIEKNKRVKIKSTGLVSYRFFEVAREFKKIKNELIENSFNEANFNFPFGTLTLKSKRKMYLLNIKKLETLMLEKAKDNAKINFETEFIKREGEKVITSKGTFKTKILVGADGPLSRVALTHGINLSKEVYSSSEFIVKGKFDKNVEMFFDDKYSKNYFAWIVPINSRKAKVGIITEKNALASLKRFVEEKLKNIKIESWYSDLIRIGIPTKTYFENGFLIGDAAGQCKPYSAGGFTYAAISINIAANAIRKALACNDYSADFFKENYENKWKKILLPSIKKGYIVQEGFKILKKSKVAFFVAKNIRKFIEKIDLDLL